MACWPERGRDGLVLRFGAGLILVWDADAVCLQKATAPRCGRGRVAFLMHPARVAPTRVIVDGLGLARAGWVGSGFVVSESLSSASE